MQKLKECDRVLVDGMASITGRPNRTIIEAIKKHLKVLNLVEEIAISKTEWTKRIHAADSIYWIKALLFLLLLMSVRNINPM